MNPSLRAWAFLVAFTARRHLLSKKSWVAAGLIGIAGALVALLGLRRPLSTEFFSEAVTLGVFNNFIFPVLMLAYGTAALGEDREDRTLVYLLTRPLPRWGIYLGKYLAVAPLGLGAGLGAYWGLCQVGAQAAQSDAAPAVAQAFATLWDAFLLGGLAYLAIFHFLAAISRHATLLAVVYVLFIEVLIGNFPGIIKMVSVHYYILSITIADGAALDISLPEQWIILPMDGGRARFVLAGIAIVVLLIGTWRFQRSEYADEGP
jgi:ABC-type transport system involved in multi-copper enzyme maturation permease subunit